MKIFNSINIPKNYKASALAIGNFDGIHKGHQKVFGETKKLILKSGNFYFIGIVEFGENFFGFVLSN